MVIAIVALGACDGVVKRAAADQGGQAEAAVYVPTDLQDCFAVLKDILEPEQIELMREGSEDDMVRHHFGLGMWMRNNWGLWGGSRLSKWFNDRGIRHPDDMSGIILTSFWRHLNDRPTELDAQIEYYQKYWNQMHNR